VHVQTSTKAATMRTRCVLVLLAATISLAIQMKFIPIGGMGAGFESVSVAKSLAITALYPPVYYLVRFDVRYRYSVLWVSVLVAGYGVARLAEHFGLAGGDDSPR